MNLLRIESLFWGYSLRFRRVLRGLRAWLSDAKHALATALGRAPATRIRSLPPRSRRSDSPSGEFDLIVDGDPEDIPQVAAEALRLVAAAEGSAVVVAGAGRPVPGRSGRPVPGRSTVPVHAFRGRSTLKLLQDRPHTGSLAALGKSIPILHGDQEPRHPLPSFPFDMVDGYWLPPGQGVGRRLRRRLSDPYAGLGSLPVLQGPPTVLFLLPFLAVGGAERLLFDLLEDLVTRYRCLVVTVEPHRHELGSTVHRGAWLTPHVFTLGDWLPREAHFGAVSHLIRRFDVRHLVSWNGTIFFFDFVAALGRRFPGLGISSQLYHFKGGWTARTSPAVIRSVQTHIAVNNPIRDALVHRLAIPDDNVRVIHHGVPKAPERDEHRARALRDELGIPARAVVVGTFIRLHAQKRPLDILALARRFGADDLWFLLMGGGPLDGTVDGELDHAPIENLVRLPMQTDPLPYYDVLDLCLMTSEYEGLPVFLLDGMARGLPCVATAVGDIPMLFEAGGGIADAAPGDLDVLEASLSRLLDSHTRAEAGRRARQTVEQRFSLERYCRAYEQVFFGSTSGARP